MFLKTLHNSLNLGTNQPRQKQHVFSLSSIAISSNKIFCLVSASLIIRVQAKSPSEHCLPSQTIYVQLLIAGIEVPHEYLWQKQQKLSLKLHGRSYGSFIVSGFKFNST